MAKIKTPLLSLGASGSLGKSIVFGTWKGIATARQHVVPANPKTAAQTEQRDIMTKCVECWRGGLTGDGVKAGWNKFATASGKAQSGFNAFTSSAAKGMVQVQDFGVVASAADMSDNQLDLTLVNAHDNAASAEAGLFRLIYGATPSQMLDEVSAPLGQSGEVTFTMVGTGTVYCQVLKDAGLLTALPRSGIFTVALP